MRNSPRKKFFIDRKVQGTLVYRILLYWILFISGTFIILSGFPLVVSWFVRSPGAPTASQILLQTWRVFWPAIFASGLLLPLLILDVIRVSHRFAGPVYRLKSALRDLADGVSTEPIHFRDGDFWFSVAEEYNRVAGRIAELKSAHARDCRPPSRGTEPVTDPSQTAL